MLLKKKVGKQGGEPAGLSEGRWNIPSHKQAQELNIRDSESPENDPLLPLA